MEFRAFLLFFSIFTYYQAECATINLAITVKRIPFNPNGYPRPVIAILDTHNITGSIERFRPFPGPTIRGKKGDNVVLEVTNGFKDVATSIHFHGMHMRHNAWMDGVVGVTQPVIPPGGVMTYRFKLEDIGTHWYHSHAGVQQGDGLFGAIVVEYPNNQVDPIISRYAPAEEHILMIQDWFHEVADDLILNQKGPYNAFRYSDNQPFVPNYPWRASAALINGRGQFNCTYDNTCVNWFRSSFNPTDVSEWATSCGERTQCIFSREPFYGYCDSKKFIPEEFVCRGPTTRIRLINPGHNAPLKFWIDQHNLTVVARDGVEVAPVTLAAVTIGIGQRYDLIVACTARPLKYRIFVAIAHTLLPPGANTPEIKFWTSALLTYPGAIKDAEPVSWPPNGPPEPVLSDHVPFEYSLRPLVPRVAQPAVKRIVMQYTVFYEYISGEPLEEWTINNITFVTPKKPMMQEVFLGRFANSTIVDHGKGPDGNQRRTNIFHLEYGKTYELVLVGIDMQQHPWHIHGYSLDFVAAGVLDKDHDFAMGSPDACGFNRRVGIREELLDRILPKFDKPAPVIAVADTFTMPKFGYVAARFTATNQGPWFMHCHIDWHMAEGMAVILSVEKNGLYPDVKAPPNDFPAYMPLVDMRSK